MQLSSIIIATSDKARLRTFYHELLGVPFNAQGKLESAGIVLHPARHSHVQGPPIEPYRVMLTFAVADIQATAAELRAKGVIFSRDPAQEVWGGWLATFLDPDGNYLQLIQLVED